MQSSVVALNERAVINNISSISLKKLIVLREIVRMYAYKHYFERNYTRSYILFIIIILQMHFRVVNRYICV